MRSRRHRQSNTNEERYLWLRVGSYWFAWLATLVMVLIINPALTAGIFGFPLGLLMLLPQGESVLVYAVFIGPITWAVGWAVYGALTFFMMRTKRNWQYILLYLIFCALLALNVKGCYEASLLRFE